MNRRVFICFGKKQRRLGGDLIAAVYQDAFQRLGFEAYISEIGAKGRSIDYREFKPHDIAFIISDVGVRAMWDQGYWPKSTNILLNFEFSAYSTRREYRSLWLMKKWHSVKRQENGRNEGWQSSIYALFDFSPGTHWHQAEGIRAAFCPTGYSEKAEFEIPPEILFDVSFLGQRTKRYLRRKGFFHTLLKKRFRLGLMPAAMTYQQIEQRWTSIKKMLRCGVWLHVHRTEELVNFPCIRLVLYGFSNRRCVVSEPCVWSPPLVDGTHWVLSSSGNMIRTIRGLMKDNERRERIGNTGYEFVKRYWRQEDHLKKALQEVDLL